VIGDPSTPPSGDAGFFFACLPTTGTPPPREDPRGEAAAAPSNGLAEGGPCRHHSRSPLPTRILTFCCRLETHSVQMLKIFLTAVTQTRPASQIKTSSALELEQGRVSELL
jgi:hypothetical protein